MSDISRRQLLTIGGFALSPVCLLASESNAIELGVNFSGSRFISAASLSDESHVVQGIVLEGSSYSSWFSHALPGRAHHVAINERAGLYVVMSRRPGNWMVVGDLQSGDLLQTISLQENRHGYGHGIFSDDGSAFYSVEHDIENAEGDSGLVGVWHINRASSVGIMQKVEEYSTRGVGPHELVMMPDGQTLAVANGGMRTSPVSGREVLNLSTMKPSLVYLDCNSGEVVEQVFLSDAYQQCSIRHLDVNKAGHVALALQYQGNIFDDVPLVGLHRRGGQIEFANIPLAEQQQMKQYCGSIRFDESGRFFAVSNPRGNRITFWDSETAQYLNFVRSRDGCGVSAFGEGFVYSSGTGKLAYFDLEEQGKKSLSSGIDQSLLWDNHLSIVNA